MKRIAALVFRSLAVSIFTLVLLIALPLKLSADSNQFKAKEDIVIEVIRLKVPLSSRTAWLKAEQDTWAPWLAKQNGFLSRELYWDKNNEEATLMIKWATRRDWKSISQSELAALQESFEISARNKTGQLKGNPFPLMFEGELLPQ